MAAAIRGPTDRDKELPMKRVPVLIALMLLALAMPAIAQSYPNRTVSVIVPYPAGGSVDVVARLVVQKLNESMGANFIVENRAGGAGGAVGTNTVARAAPDGYTLMLTASIHITRRSSTGISPTTP